MARAGRDGRRGPSPTALEVVRRHLRAVERLDAAAMADDYAEDAILRRGDVHHRGRAEIAAYFASVPGRLGRMPGRLRPVLLQIIKKDHQRSVVGRGVAQSADSPPWVKVR